MGEGGDGNLILNGHFVYKKKSTSYVGKMEEGYYSTNMRTVQQPLIIISTISQEVSVLFTNGT